MKKKIFALLLAVTMMVTLVSGVFANSVKIDTDIPMIDVTELTSDLKKDQKFTLADPAPWDLDELKQVVNIKDP